MWCRLFALFIKNGKITLITYQDLTSPNISENDKLIVKNISKQILPKMNIQQVNFDIDSQYENPLIVKSIKENIVTNVLFED